MGACDLRKKLHHNEATKMMSLGGTSPDTTAFHAATVTDSEFSLGIARFYNQFILCYEAWQNCCTLSATTTGSIFALTQKYC